MSSEHSDVDLAALELARRAFPTADGAFAEIARLEGELLLPKPTVHVVSDVHVACRSSKKVTIRWSTGACAAAGCATT